MYHLCGTGSTADYRAGQFQTVVDKSTKISHGLNGKILCSILIFDEIFIKLAYNEDMRKISDKFKFQSVWTIYFRITCP